MAIESIDYNIEELAKDIAYEISYRKDDVEIEELLSKYFDNHDNSALLKEVSKYVDMDYITEFVANELLK